MLSTATPLGWLNVADVPMPSAAPAAVPRDVPTPAPPPASVVTFPGTQNDGVGDGVAVSEREADTLLEREVLALASELTLAVTTCEGETVLLGEALKLALTLVLTLAVSLAAGDGEALTLVVADSDALTLAVGDGEALTLAVAVKDSVTDGLGVCVAAGDGDGDREKVRASSAGHAWPAAAWLASAFCAVHCAICAQASARLVLARLRLVYKPAHSALAMRAPQPPVASKQVTA